METTPSLIPQRWFRRLGAAAILAFIGSLPLMAQQGAWQMAPGPLETRWASQVSPRSVHPEYPRPQMVRRDWLNLNGLWDFAVTPKDAPKPLAYGERILVPFPVESRLSGIGRAVSEAERIWYRRSVDIPKGWRGRRVILHFGAVDFATTVYVNGRLVGEHQGGYDAFSFDVTDALDLSRINELVVSVWDPTDAGTQPRGKQVRKPGGIWYTPTSGIWQTVWLEPVQAAYIQSLKITPDIDDASVSIEAMTPRLLGGYTVDVVVRQGVGRTAKASGRPGEPIRVALKNPRLWSPEDPHLYSFTASLRLGGRLIDRVESYFGMRKVSIGRDENGHNRILLNNQPYFQLGLLDQGFWPDGLYTAPTDAALRYDIEVTKQLGFNMARKHVKIEPARWYYWADRLGLIVWQDMPSGDRYIGGNDPDITRTPESGRQFEQELTAMVQGLYNHPSIVMWVPYNEGWGQWDTARITDLVKGLDPTRLVNSASGWTDRGTGDVNDIHSYPGPAAPNPEARRATVLGEFGGLGLPVKGHTWQSERNWGYRSFTDAQSLTDAYVDLIRKLFPLVKSKGLSAAVYTQTTDVEVEVNGLLTYDRALIKMDAKTVAAANRGQFPAAAKVVEVVPTAQQAPVEWRFTTEAPAENWFGPQFNDASWKSASGGFGTRSTPNTVVRTEWNSNRIWIRRAFSLPDVRTENLRLLVHHDEDAEVYLNGVLAARLSGFTTDYQTFAMSAEARAALKPGGNVMAISCRQTGGGQYIDAGLVLVERSK